MECKLDDISDKFGDMEDHYFVHSSKITESDWDSPVYKKSKCFIDFVAIIPKLMIR